jgi:DNA-binding MarR family transcriptional regulator
MPVDRLSIAHTIVELFPSLMGNFRSGLRCSGLNLDPAHFRLLAMIGHRTWNLTELAGLVGVTPATMSNSIDILVERGWVIRNPGTEDRRRVQVEITPDGRETMLNVHRNMEMQFANRLKEASETDLAIIREGISRLYQVLTTGEALEVPCSAVPGSVEV